MKTKKLWKIIALLSALVLLGFVLFFACAFVGNPLSHFLASRDVKRYVAETYAGTDYQVEDVSYSFKEGGYIASISSPSSEDTYFTVSYDLLGRRGYDSYEYRVLNKANTWSRLEGEYRALCDRVLESDSFPYTQKIAYGTLDTSVPVEEIPEPGVRPEPFKDELVLDQQYDIPALGVKYGQLVLYVESEEVSAEKAAEILLEVRRRMEEGGAPFFSISFTLEYPREPGEKRAGKLNILNFPYAELYEEGMVERVKAAAAATDNYYAKMDAIRAEEEAALMAEQDQK